ncbi:TonB-dependent receptor domain-containing protein [Sessilibacter sp. MAH4]
MLKHQFKLSLLAFAVAQSSHLAWAENEIEVVEVEGHRVNGVNVVDFEELQKKQANDLEDIFRDQPGISVGGSLGVAQKIYVRGLEDTNLNITIDGANQAGYLFHHQGRVSVDPELLKRVEIKAGAGTALDGPGALGGAIQFETKDAEDLLDANENFGSLFKTGYNSNNRGYRVSANLYGRLTENTSGLLVLGQTKGEEIHDGHGDEIPNTDAEQNIGLLKLTSRITENQTLRLSYDTRDDNAVRNLRANFIDFNGNTATNQTSERETTTFSYSFNSPSDLVDLKVTAYQSETEITNRESAANIDFGATVESYGLDIRNTSLLGSHRLVYGMDFREDEGASFDEIERFEETADVYGVYVQDFFALTDKLSLSFGSRFDHYGLDDEDDQHFSDSGISSNINAEYAFTSHWSLRAGYSEALRGQNVKEAVLIGSRAYSPDLKSQEADNAELVLSYNYGGFKASAEVYRSEINNVVDTVADPNLGTVLDNAGDLVTRGYNVSVSQNWSRFTTGFSYSHVDPELNGEPLGDSDTGIGTSYGDVLSVNMAYHFEKTNLELGWNGRLVRSLDQVPDGSPKKPGYNTQDIYLEWSPTGKDTMTVNLTINNLFDQYYLDHGTFGFSGRVGEIIGVAEPGRDVRLGLSWKI